MDVIIKTMGVKRAIIVYGEPKSLFFNIVRGIQGVTYTVQMESRGNDSLHYLLLMKLLVLNIC